MTKDQTEQMNAAYRRAALAEDWTTSFNEIYRAAIGQCLGVDRGCTAVMDWFQVNRPSNLQDAAQVCDTCLGFDADWSQYGVSD